MVNAWPQRRLARLARIWLSATVVLAIAGAALFVWLRTAQVLSNGKPPASHGQPNSIVWANRVFTNSASLQAWLEARGISYPTWIRLHPGVAAIVDPQAATVAPSTSSSGTPARPGSGWHGLAVWGTATLLVLMLASGLFIAARKTDPARLYRRVRMPLRRHALLYALAGLGTVVLGLLIASWGG